MRYSRGPTLSHIASTNNQSSRVLKLNLEAYGQTCVAYVNVLLDTNEGENDDDHSLECATKSGDTFDVEVHPSFVRENLINGNLISGRTLIELDGAHISKNDSGTLFFTEGIKLETNRNLSDSIKSRRFHGINKFFFVRLITGDGETSLSDMELRSAQERIHGQLSSCSHGMTKMERHTTKGLTNDVIDGVTTLSFPDDTVKSLSIGDVLREVNIQFGHD